MGMDNQIFKVSGVGDDPLESALSLLLQLVGLKTATHYAIVEPYGLIFFWADPSRESLKIKDDVKPLPYSMDWRAMIDFAKNWLKRGAVYGKQPDHDGDNERGWYVYVDAWGTVADSHYAMCAVAPYWAAYGK